MAIGYKKAIDLLKQGKELKLHTISMTPRIDWEKIRYDAFDKLEHDNIIEEVSYKDCIQIFKLADRHG